MIIWLAIAFPLISLSLRSFRKRKLAAFTVFIGPALLYFLSTQYAVNFLISKTEQHSQILNPQFGQNNMIVLLTGGHVLDKQNNFSPHIAAESRALEALRILNLCRSVATRKCKLLITGGDPKNLGQSESRTTFNKLSAIGADTSNILLEELSDSTEENAFMSSQLIKSEKSDKIFIVTSGYHTHRAELWFQHFGISADMAPSDTLQAAGPWWLPRPYNFLYAEICLRELAGILWMKIKTFSL